MNFNNSEDFMIIPKLINDWTTGCCVEAVFDISTNFPISVSYTHLDVYKRQQYDNETGNGQDGYAGAFGNAIGKLQIVIE